MTSQGIDVGAKTLQKQHSFLLGVIEALYKMQPTNLNITAATVASMSPMLIGDFQSPISEEEQGGGGVE